MNFKLKEIFYTDPEAIIILDDALIIQDVNPTFLGWFSQYGGDWDHFLNRNIKDVFILNAGSKIDFSLLEQGRFLHLTGVFKITSSKFSKEIHAWLMPIRDEDSTDIKAYYMRILLDYNNADFVIESAVSDSWRLIEFMDLLAKNKNIDDMLSLVSYVLNNYFRADGMLVYFAPSFLKKPKLISVNLPDTFDKTQQDRLIEMFADQPYLIQQYSNTNQFYYTRSDRSEFSSDNLLWSVYPDSKTFFGTGLKVGDYQHGFVALFFEEEKYPFEVRQQIWLNVVARVLVLTITKHFYEEQVEINKIVREQTIDAIHLPIIEFSLTDFSILRANKSAKQILGKRFINSNLDALLDTNSFVDIQKASERMLNKKEIVSSKIPADIKTVKGHMAVELFMAYSPVHLDSPSAFLAVYPELSTIGNSEIGAMRHVESYTHHHFLRAIISMLIDHITAIMAIPPILLSNMKDIPQDSLESMFALLIMLDNRADKLKNFVNIIRSIQSLEADYVRVDNMYIELFMILNLKRYLFDNRINFVEASLNRYAFVEINHEKFFYYLFFLFNFLIDKIGHNAYIEISTDVKRISIDSKSSKERKPFFKIGIKIEGGSISLYKRIVKYLKQDAVALNNYTVFSLFRQEIYKFGGIVKHRLNTRGDLYLSLDIFLPMVEEEDTLLVSRDVVYTDDIDTIRFQGNAILLTPNGLLSSEIADALIRYGLNVHIINDLSSDIAELKIALKPSNTDIVLIDDSFRLDIVNKILDYVSEYNESIQDKSIQVLILGPPQKSLHIMRPNLNTHIHKPFTIQHLIRVIDRLLKGIHA